MRTGVGVKRNLPLGLAVVRSHEREDRRDIIATKAKMDAFHSCIPLAAQQLCGSLLLPQGRGQVAFEGNLNNPN